MSLRAIYSASTGMEAHQFALDNVANNIANASTNAFKRSRANFEDTFYENVRVPGAQTSNGTTPAGTHVGLGTRIQSTSIDFQQGSLLPTKNPLDVAISGAGFFQVTDGPGVAYTRAGNFTLNSEGSLMMTSATTGHLISPQITIPPNAQEIGIGADGRVTYKDTQNNTVEVGQIQLYQFTNVNGLLQKGENLYGATSASGPAQGGEPGGPTGLGKLTQGMLEVSNVEPVHELVDLIKTQRNFELNSQIIQAADQMLQLISNLRRF